MPLVWSFRQEPYPLITGVTGTQGEDTPETSGPWELFSSLKSYGEVNNSPTPYYTLWAGFCGAGLAFAAADEKPPCPWYICALLKSGSARFERLEFHQRDAVAALEVTVEIGKRKGDDIVWRPVLADSNVSGLMHSLSFNQVRGAGIRLRVDKVSDAGKYPGLSQFQAFGFL